MKASWHRRAGLALALSLILLTALPHSAWAQRSVGELRLRVTDTSGGTLAAQGTIEGAATQVRRDFATSTAGIATLSALPMGRYTVTVASPGFTSRSEIVDVSSEVPLERAIALAIAPLQSSVTVTADQSATLINPTRSGSVRFLGGTELIERASPAPGRSLIDLVAAQPGWLLEANGVLHARGSEYQVQYVVDGIPLRDNRSPAFSQLFGAEEFDALTVRTGGYPAEFGGKLGGVVEVNTARDIRRGPHGTASLQVGSFSTWGGHGLIHYGGMNMSGGIGFEGASTDRYLDPPTESNFTNHGSARGISGRFERGWTDSARTRVYAYARRATFEVPNETLQQQAGQRQRRSATEGLGQAAHQSVLSSDTLLNVGAMLRRTEARLESNEASIPIRASQDRGVTETYVNGTVTRSRGAHEIRAGGDLTFAGVEEQFDSLITARRYSGVRVFDSDLPGALSFHDEGDLRDQAAFIQDRLRLGPATVSVGLRYDHHRLVSNEHAWSPRLSGAWTLDRAGLVFHAAYDRTFETQPIENILIASADVEGFGDEASSRPLVASRGHFVEGGVSATIKRRVRLESTWFQRTQRDATDDEVLLNSGISFPITFASARIRGWELSADVPVWSRWSGSAAYSYSRGIGRLPLTGGLFLGDEAELVESNEEFALTQDQRHTFHGRLRTTLGPRAWLAAGLRVESGLPVELEGDVDEADLQAQFGDAVVARVNLDEGRVRPSWSVALSGGVQLVSAGERSLKLQFDAFNVFNRLNVINFAGLLSGTALAPPRSVTVQLRTAF